MRVVGFSGRAPVPSLAAKYGVIGIRTVEESAYWVPSKKAASKAPPKKRRK